MWEDLVPIAICFVAILVLVSVIAGFGSAIDAKFRELMAGVNDGHQLWCQAGVEKQPRCTCNTNQYLSFWQMRRRYNEIALAALDHNIDVAEKL